MNIQQYIVEISATLAKLDERTATILDRVNKIENHFQAQLDDFGDRIDKLEKDKAKIWGGAMALGVAASMIWGLIGGVVTDSIKSHTIEPKVEVVSLK